MIVRLSKIAFTIYLFLLGAIFTVAHAQATDTPDTWQSKYIPKQDAIADLANVGDNIDSYSGVL